MIKEISIGVLSVVLAATTIGTANYYNKVASGNADNANLNQQTERRISAMKADTKGLTQTKVAASMMKDGVNLNDAKKDASDRINNTFKVAYGGVKQEDVDKDQQMFKQQLGASFGKYLSNLTRPQDEIQYAASMDQARIGFGEYNASDQTIPMAVAVSYKGTGTSKANSNDYWTMTYHVKSKSFSNVKWQTVVPPQANNMNTDQFVAK